MNQEKSPIGEKNRKSNKVEDAWDRGVEEAKKMKREADKKRMKQLIESEFEGVQLSRKIEPLTGFLPGKNFREQPLDLKFAKLQFAKENLPSWVYAISIGRGLTSEETQIFQQELYQLGNDYIDSFSNEARAERDAKLRKEAESKIRDTTKSFKTQGPKEPEKSSDFKEREKEQAERERLEKLAGRIIERYLNNPERYLKDDSISLTREQFETLTDREEQKRIAKKMQRAGAKEYHPDALVSKDEEMQKEGEEMFKAVLTYLSRYL